MTFQNISLLRNIGQFDSVAAGAQIPLTKLTLVYAENGRGKTTLAAVLRSLSTGTSHLIDERRRVGTQHPPHIVLKVNGSAVTFQQGAWSSYLPQVVVFDDAFVAANVCSGIEIETAHRQNLHELILGSQGQVLNNTLLRHIDSIDAHNRAIRTKQDAIPATIRGALTVDAFCALAGDLDIDARIIDAERARLAARSADSVRQQAGFASITLPGFDAAFINTLLARSLPILEAEAAARVREHIRSLGKGGEAWVSEGMSRVASASKDVGSSDCPFCAQSLAGSSLINHYQSYFSESYKELKSAIRDAGQGINTTHGSDLAAAFERAVRIATQNREFWKVFIYVPPIDIDTVAIIRVWNTAREAVLSALRAKAASPLEATGLSDETLAAIVAFNACCNTISSLSNALQLVNPLIAVLKEKTASANVVTIEADIAKFNLIKVRQQASINALCQDYLAEKSAKTLTENLRNQARAALDHHREHVFPLYETAINLTVSQIAASYVALAAWAAGQGTSDGAGNSDPDGCDRIWHVTLRSDRGIRGVDNLRIRDIL